MRILVVEDDIDIGELVCEDLGEQGYAVDWAKDGDEALSLLKSFPYDLLVLDIMIPGPDGFEVTEILRAKENNLPILILTAQDAVDSCVKGLEKGADDYLAKPFYFKELRARILALLRRAQGKANNHTVVGRCELNLSQKRVWFKGLEVKLSSTEYKLLRFLMSYPDNYFTREELLEHVWSGESCIDPRTVDSYIHYLRRKLAGNTIETRRGAGYRFRG